MTDPTMGFSFRNEGADSFDIEIYDDIGRSWYGDTVSSKQVKAKLQAAKNAKTINLRVNSSGGDVIEGFAIYNLLHQHPARVVAHVDALAASIASVIIMAADEIHIAKNAFVMIHNPYTPWARGEASDLRRTADILDKLRGEIATAYVSRTGLDTTKVLSMMAATTWMTADEAHALGFANTVKPAKKGESTMKSARAQAFAFLNLANLDSVPEELRERVESARQSFRDEQTPVQTPIDNTVNPPSRAEAQEKKNRMDQLATLLAALGVADATAAVNRIHLLARIEHATGKTGDEAQGLILAFKASHEKLPQVQADLDKANKRIEDLEGSAEAQELDVSIAKAKAENKLTPAMEKDYRDQYAAGEITLKGVQTLLGNLQPIAALALKQAPGAAGSATAPKPGEQANNPAAQSGEGVNAAGVPTFNGKTFDEMKPIERHNLNKADAALYARMRETSKGVKR